MSQFNKISCSDNNNDDTLVSEIKKYVYKIVHNHVAVNPITVDNINTYKRESANHASTFFKQLKKIKLIQNLLNDISNLKDTLNKYDKLGVTFNNQEQCAAPVQVDAQAQQGILEPTKTFFTDTIYKKFVEMYPKINVKYECRFTKETLIANINAIKEDLDAAIRQLTIDANNLNLSLSNLDYCKNEYEIISGFMECFD